MHSTWTIEVSVWSSSLRWIVTHSWSRSGSIATAQTSSGGAAMSMVVVTSLIERRNLPGGERLHGLPLAQRMLDRGVERVQPHTEQGGRPVVTREQIPAQALHQRPDQGVVLAGDLRGDAAGDDGRREPEPHRHPVDEHVVGDALDHLAVRQ